MSDELKACPFCGTDTALEVSNYTEVICTKCFNVPNIKGWNTRPLEDALRSRVEELERGKNTAYSERDKLVAALSKCYPSVLARHEESDTEWEQNWRWIVFINTPSGQVSWHIHDTELAMFDHLPRTPNNPWDGHTTEEKYTRLERIPYQDTWIGHLQKRVEELERELGYAQDNTKTVSEVLQNTIARRDAEIARLRAELETELVRHAGQLIDWTNSIINPTNELARLREQVRWHLPDEEPEKYPILIEDEYEYGFEIYHTFKPACIKRWMYLPIPPEVEG